MPLAEVISRAYEVFAAYRIEGPLEVCTCDVCVSPTIVEELTRCRVRDLRVEALAEYTGSAHGVTERVSEQLRHFLPRYFELIAAGTEPDTLEASVCLRRLAEIDYRSQWPEREVAVIDEFFLAHALRVVGTPIQLNPRLLSDSASAAEGALLLASSAGGDISQILHAWGAIEAPIAALHAAALINEISSTTRSLPSAFWGSNAPRQAETVVAWLLRSETSPWLERAFFVTDDAVARATLSNAVDMLS